MLIDMTGREYDEYRVSVMSKQWRKLGDVCLLTLTIAIFIAVVYSVIGMVINVVAHDFLPIWLTPATAIVKFVLLHLMHIPSLW